MAEARIDIVVNDNSINSLETKLQTLQSEIKEVGIGSAEFKRLSAEIRATEKSLSAANQKLAGLNIPEIAGNLAKAAAGVGAAFAVINVAIGDNEEASETARQAQEALVAVLGLAAVAEGVLGAANVARTLALGAETKAQVENTQATNQNTVSSAENTVATAALTAAKLKLAAAEASLAEAQAISGEAVEVAEGYYASAKKELEALGTATTQATNSSKGFGASLRALGPRIVTFLTNPFTIAAAAIGALILILRSVNKELSKARVVAEYGVEIENISDKVVAASSGFDDLTQKLSAYAAGLEAGVLSGDKLTKVQDQIRETALEAGLTLDQVNTILDSGTAALTTYIAQLPELLKAEVIFASLKEQVEELVKVQNDPTLSDPGFWQSAGSYVTSFGNLWQYQINQAVAASQNYQESVTSIEERIAQLQTALAKQIEENGNIFDQLFGGKDGGSSAPARVTDIFKEIQQLQRDFVRQQIQTQYEGFEEEQKLAEQSRKEQIEDLNRRREEVRKDSTISRAQKKQFLEAAKDEEERIEQEYANTVDEINKKSVAAYRANLQEETDDLQSSLQRRLDIIEQFNDLESQEEAEALRARLLNAEISETEYQSGLLDIRKKFLEREEEERTNTILNSRKGFEDELAKLEGDNSEAAKERRAELNDFISQSYIDEQALIKEFNVKYAELANDRKEVAIDAEKEITEETQKEQEERAENFQNYVQGLTDVLVGGLEIAVQYYASQEELLQIKLQQDLEALDKRLERSQAGFTARQEALNKNEVLSAAAKENAIAQLEEQRLAEEKKIQQERERLEKRAAKEGLILQSKQAKANLAIGIARAISEAAIGISAATAQAPLTFGASLALIAPIAAALGAAIASYAAQQQSIDAQLGGLGFAGGGFVSVTGSGTSDSIPARLSNGEYVVNAQSTANNLPLLEAINSTGSNGGADMASILGRLSKQLDSLENKPVKAYVVTSDLDEANRTEDYIERRAQL